MSANNKVNGDVKGRSPAPILWRLAFVVVGILALLPHSASSVIDRILIVCLSGCRSVGVVDFWFFRLFYYLGFDLVRSDVVVVVVWITCKILLIAFKVVRSVPFVRPCVRPAVRPSVVRFLCIQQQHSQPSHIGPSLSLWQSSVHRGWCSWSSADPLAFVNNEK